MPEQPSWTTLPAMQPFVSGSPMMTEAGELRVPHSCSTFNNLTVLAHWFAKLKPTRTLEIGLGFGASAALLLSLHKQAGGFGRHHAIDAFQAQDWGNAALRHLKTQGLDAALVFHPQLSALALPKLFEAKERFGLIYVDGSHLFEEVLLDFYFSDKLLETGGILAFDDSTHPHVAKVLRFIRANLSQAYQEQSPFAITAPQQAWWKAPLARVLGRQQMTIFRKTAELQRSWAVPLKRF